jgi:CheY-like chemotaxis protein
MAGEKILVVDDVGFNRLLLEKDLTAAGYRVEQAPGGPEAIKMLARDRFDLVISDLMMPGMDGLQLLEERKKSKSAEDGAPIPCPPFILCTAHVGTDTTEEAVKKGFVDVLTKPIDQKRLLESVNQALIGTEDSLNVSLRGNDATIAKTLAGMTGGKPEQVVAGILQIVSLCDFSDGIDNLDALRHYLCKKLGVDLTAQESTEEE